MGLMQVVRDIEFIPIGELSRREHLRILTIRNQPEVRRNMYTSHLIGEREHFAWIEGLKTDARTLFSAVAYGGRIIGGISLNSISHADKRADWAFYLDGDTQGKGLGSALEFKFLDYALADLQKLNCEVLAFNAPVIKMHKRFGFVEEGIRRRHILKDGEAHDVYLLGITAEEWQQARESLVEGVFRER